MYLTTEHTGESDRMDAVGWTCHQRFLQTPAKRGAVSLYTQQAEIERVCVCVCERERESLCNCAKLVIPGESSLAKPIT